MNFDTYSMEKFRFSSGLCPRAANCTSSSAGMSFMVEGVSFWVAV